MYLTSIRLAYTKINWLEKLINVARNIFFYFNNCASTDGVLIKFAK